MARVSGPLGLYTDNVLKVVCVSGPLGLYTDNVLKAARVSGPLGLYTDNVLQAFVHSLLSSLQKFTHTSISQSVPFHSNGQEQV